MSSVRANMKLLRVAEVAETLSVSPMTIYRMIKAGELPAIRIGRSYRIEQRTVDAFLDTHGVGWSEPVR
jgi:excisionase family DNA binding protein